MQGLVAVEEEVPRCQIQTHVSVCGCHNRLSAADKIQQQIAGEGGGELALSLPCTPLLLLILQVIELCARRVQLFIFSEGVLGLVEQVGFKRATCNPSKMYSGAKGPELPSVAKSLGVIFKLKVW